MSYKDRMYATATVSETLVIEGESYPVEVRPPKWSEFVEAEARAMTSLKDSVAPEVDANGIPQPLSEEKRRALNIQTGLELAKVCVLKVGEMDTKEPGFWDKQHLPEQAALGSLMLRVLWESGVGRKNSQRPAAQPATSGAGSKP
jgi:hypothetical protein